MLNEFFSHFRFDKIEKKKSRPESVDCTPSDSIIPGSSERPLIPLQPQSKEQKGPNCIKVLTTSGWNPPPGEFLIAISGNSIDSFEFQVISFCYLII